MAQSIVIASWATALGAITAEALAERDPLSIDVARKKLDELVGPELLERHTVLVGHPDLYTEPSRSERLGDASRRLHGRLHHRNLRTRPLDQPRDPEGVVPSLDPVDGWRRTVMAAIKVAAATIASAT